MRYLICYDITDNRKRRRIATYLESNSIRIQESVFVGDFSKPRYMEVRNKLIVLADIDEDSDDCDSVFMYPLCDSCWSKHWYIGVSKEVALDEAIVI